MSRNPQIAWCAHEPPAAALWAECKNGSGLGWRYCQGKVQTRATHKTCKLVRTLCRGSTNHDTTLSFQQNPVRLSPFRVWCLSGSGAECVPLCKRPPGPPAHLVACLPASRTVSCDRSKFIETEKNGQPKPEASKHH